MSQLIHALGPIQTSCFCRPELNSAMKFDKSTAEARRLKQTFQLSSALKLCRATRLWHGSNSNVVLLPRQTKFINYINVFWRDCVPAGRIVTCPQQCSENPEFGTTLVQRLNQSRTSPVLQSNLLTHAR